MMHDFMRQHFERYSWQPHTIEQSKGGPYVYFMVSGDHVKIGTSGNLQERLYQVKTRQENATITPSGVRPEGVILAASIPGGRRTESHAHLRHTSYWLGGEWFNLTSSIWENIERARHEQAELEVSITKHAYECQREANFPDLPPFNADTAYAEAYQRLCDRFTTPEYCWDSEAFDRGYIV